MGELAYNLSLEDSCEIDVSLREFWEEMRRTGDMGEFAPGSPSRKYLQVMKKEVGVMDLFDPKEHVAEFRGISLCDCGLVSVDDLSEGCLYVVGAPPSRAFPAPAYSVRRVTGISKSMMMCDFFRDGNAVPNQVPLERNLLYWRVPEDKAKEWISSLC